MTSKLSLDQLLWEWDHGAHIGPEFGKLRQAELITIQGTVTPLGEKRLLRLYQTYARKLETKVALMKSVGDQLARPSAMEKEKHTKLQIAWREASKV